MEALTSLTEYDNQEERLQYCHDVLTQLIENILNEKRAQLDTSQFNDAPFPFSVVLLNSDELISLTEDRRIELSSTPALARHFLRRFC